MTTTAARVAPTLTATVLGDVEHRDLAPDGPAPDRHPLVMLTGFGTTIGHWPATLVDPLAARRRLVIVQNPGVGRSAGLPDAGDGCTAVAARVAALVDALGLGPCDVLGWSMGGMVAQALAVDRPDLVSRLVLAASTPGTGTAVPPLPGVLPALASGDPARMLDVLFPGDPAAASAYRADIAGDPALGAVTGPVLAAQGAATRRWRDGAEPAGTRTPTITVPVLLLHGDRDALAPPANTTLLAEVLTGAEIERRATAGHGVLFTDPGLVAALIGSWLDRGTDQDLRRPSPARGA